MRIVILGSGRGSNAKALLEAWKAGQLGLAEPIAIFSDNAKAGILDLGNEFGIKASYLDPGEFRTKLSPEREGAYIKTISELKPDLIILAGFMRVIKEPFLDAFSNKIINLHPSLLPSFKGLNGIKQAFDYGVKVTGCTVHYVTKDLDGGPILGQLAVEIEPEDSLECLEEKIHQAEHELLPMVVRKLSLKQSL